MKKTSNVTTKFQQRRKFLLILPLFVLPALFVVFYALGGGKGDQPLPTGKSAGMGFNMELPPPIFDKKEDKMDKLAFYKRADADSIRRKELLQQDPYHRRIGTPVSLMLSKPVADTQADALLRQLDLLKRKIDEPEAVKPGANRKEFRHKEVQEPKIPAPQLTFDPPRRMPDTNIMHTDPELDRLNEMLDKIVKLQKNEHGEEEKPMPATDMETRASAGIMQDKSIQQVAVAVPAVVENDQELVNGATIALRLTSAICYNGMVIPKGQMAYGMVTMNNDRMQVAIHSIRCGQSILSTAWQVYDLDGLPGIHIPDALGRQVARQSADQSIGSLNLSTYDPSIGAQMAGAGIQAAKNLLSRKVKAVPVMVPGDYHVLLREIQPGGSLRRVIQDTAIRQTGDSVQVIMPPSPDSLEPFLHASVSEDKVSLILKGIYQRRGMLWLYLVVKNKGAMALTPDQLRCSIRQGKRLRRMAVQELPVQLLYDSLPSKVESESEQVVMVGMKPIGLAKDKKFIAQLDERDGMRHLELKISAKTWTKRK